MAGVLASSATVRARISDKRAVFIGAVYDLRTGRVRFIGEHPEQSLLLETGSGAIADVAPETDR